MVTLGATKFNFGTVLKQAIWKPWGKPASYHPPCNPHPYLGIGGNEDIMIAGREAVRRKAEETHRNLRV